MPAHRSWHSLAEGKVTYMSSRDLSIDPDICNTQCTDTINLAGRYVPGCIHACLLTNNMSCLSLLKVQQHQCLARTVLCCIEGHPSPVQSPFHQGCICTGGFDAKHSLPAWGEGVFEAPAKSKRQAGNLSRRLAVSAAHPPQDLCILHPTQAKAACKEALWIPWPPRDQVMAGP